MDKIQKKYGMLKTIVLSTCGLVLSHSLSSWVDKLKSLLLNIISDLWCYQEHISTQGLHKSQDEEEISFLNDMLQSLIGQKKPWKVTDIEITLSRGFDLMVKSIRGLLSHDNPMTKIIQRWLHTEIFKPQSSDFVEEIKQALIDVWFRSPHKGNRQSTTSWDRITYWSVER